jgi:type IV pilus assembly protein PilX
MMHMFHITPPLRPRHPPHPAYVRHSHVYRRAVQTQSGAALVIALLMLIVLLMLGIAAVHIGLQSEKMSRNRRDRQIAWQAAEAALLEAEYDIGNPDSPRYILFGNMVWNESASDKPDVPGKPKTPKTPETPGTSSVTYGSHSGHIMQTAVGTLPAQLPLYQIEILPRAADQPSSDLSRRYRISALGFGPDPHTRVMLQSIFRRQSSAAVADTDAVAESMDTASQPPLPSMRLSWREIAARNFK